MAMSPQTAFLVLGMHRSGTSAVARAICALGATGPADEMPPQADNPGGFCEPLSVVRLNDRILKALGSSWADPRPWAEDYLTEPSACQLEDWVRAEFGAQMVAALRESFAEAPLICLKDPRVCLFPRAWTRVLEHQRYQVVPIYVCRHPLAVAESLQARNQMPAPKAFRLWAKYTLSVLHALAATRAACVSFEHLVSQPDQVLKGLVSGIDGLDSSNLPDATSLVDATSVHHTVGDAEWESSHLSVPFMRDVKATAESWPTLELTGRRACVVGLRQRFLKMSYLFGQARSLPRSVRQFQSWPPLREESQPRRLLLHYHLFKNAGTSVDAILKENFGAWWCEKEFRPSRPSNAPLVEDWLRANPECRVLSSHTATGPLPSLPGLEVLPIIFVRHPISRLLSAYRFERKQKADTLGARLAKKTDFKGYVLARFDAKGDRTCRNFQSWRLATLAPEGARGAELDRACRAVDSLPFVGLVERFEQSIEFLAQQIRDWYPDFKPMHVRKNTTEQRAQTAEASLQELRDKFGADFVARLVEENADDIVLFQRVESRLSGRTSA